MKDKLETSARRWSDDQKHAHRANLPVASCKSTPQKTFQPGKKTNKKNPNSQYNFFKVLKSVPTAKSMYIFVC